MRKNLVNARKKANHTQKSLAKMLGISERQYQKLEAETSDGSMNIWKRLRELFGISIDLLEQVDERKD